MEFGISTASLFSRMYTEDAISYLNKNGVKTAEVFLESFCEYKPEFGEKLKKEKGDMNINSIHTLTLQFETQLYSLNKRAEEDSFLLLEETLKTAEIINAKNYTFHGSSRIKNTKLVIDFERHAKITQRIIDMCAEHKINLAYENVHWCYYNYIGFFSKLKSLTSGLKGTLDIKQARQSGIDYFEYIKEMKSDIVTVHLSDVDSEGKMCLPGKGTINFKELFKRLNDVGFDGAYIIEAYTGDYKGEEELLESLEFIKDVAKNIK